MTYTSEIDLKLPTIPGGNFDPQVFTEFVKVYNALRILSEQLDLTNSSGGKIFGIDGGSASSVYLGSQSVDGGSASSVYASY